jgi:hypothetical protein
MRHFSLPEYGSISVAAIIIAADTAFKISPDLVAHLPDFLHSPVWGFAPVVLVVFATVSFLWREFVSSHVPLPAQARPAAAPGVVASATEATISFENQISIISPPNGGLLEEGRRPHGGGCSYLIRIRLAHLPEGHKIWVLNEDEVSGKVWPQRQAAPSLRPSEWEGETFVWPKQTKITVTAVVAPPTSHEYFQYYHKFRERIDRINGAVTQAVSKGASLELNREDLEVLPLIRLPPECTNVARVQARQIGREAT